MRLGGLAIDRLGGVALVVGFLLVLLVPTLQSIGDAGVRFELGILVALVLVPGLGILAGAYAYRGGPYSGVGLCVFGSYLGVLGVGLTLGAALATGTAIALLGFGAVLFLCSLVALLGGFWRFGAFLGIIGVTGFGAEGAADSPNGDDDDRSRRS